MPRGCSDVWGRLIPVPGRGAQPRDGERRGTPAGRTCPVRDGRTDRRTEEPQPHWEPRGVRSPRKKPGCLRRGRRCRLPCAWPGTALPAPAQDAAGTAQLQLGCGFRPRSWTAPLQFWLQLICGSCLVLPWVQAQLTDSSSSFPAPVRFQLQVCCFCPSFVSGPVPYGQLQFVSSSISRMALARFSSCSLWLQLGCFCPFCFWSSAFAAQVQLEDSSTAVLAAARFHLQPGFVPSPVCCSSPSPAPPVCGSSSFPPPAPLLLPQLLLGFTSSRLQLVLVKTILAFGQVVNQSLSRLVYEYELS
ncbi:uncharacterized protein LOC142082527 isoform X2 [Calonectris borealis]|uniref:uncharacterized protein LOC142082527 isoform X2 n=1 Tax=Calonectris borealis TaxID=1323832 RepID=UPI003F4C2A48